MNVYEMEGFLRGKGLPGDLLVGESNAAYLVRKLNEATALKAERDALAVENAALKAMNDDRRIFIMNGVQLGYIKVPTMETDPALETIRIAVSPQEPTPATDAAIATVRTESHIAGLEAAANRIGVISLNYKPGQKQELIKAIGREILQYAAKLREAK